MKMMKYKLAWRYFWTHKFDPDDKRNLRLGGVVSAYGISFAMEKLFLAMAYPLPDLVWFIVYGLFALLATFWWLEDILLDFWEENTTEDDEIYNERV
jgi:hypothetical protein